MSRLLEINLSQIDKTAHRAPFADVVAGLVGLRVTVLLEIPRHGPLEKAGKNDVRIAELIRYNWSRTMSINGQSIVTLRVLRHVFAVV